VIASPFSGAFSRLRSGEPPYWPDIDGTDGIGGAVASNPEGRFVNRVEYLRLTRSDV
jgi:hypothetical protein